MIRRVWWRSCWGVAVQRGSNGTMMGLLTWRCSAKDCKPDAMGNAVWVEIAPLRSVMVRDAGGEAAAVAG